jgi:hypothetical protein
MSQTTAREQLADYAHEAWAGWMRYLFSKSERMGDGSVIIPRALVEHWSRQVETPYARLSQAEQASDLVEADKMLAILQPPA